MPQAGFNPPFAEMQNLLNEKLTPLRTKPPRLDFFSVLEGPFSFTLIEKYYRTRKYGLDESIPCEKYSMPPPNAKAECNWHRVEAGLCLPCAKQKWLWGLAYGWHILYYFISNGMWMSHGWGYHLPTTCPTFPVPCSNQVPWCVFILKKKPSRPKSYLVRVITDTTRRVKSLTLYQIDKYETKWTLYPQSTD